VITLNAYAKVNLTLEVLGKRSDGYHEVSTVLQTIGLWDRVSLEMAGDISMANPVPGVSDTENLALKAAYLMREHTGESKGVRIELEKRIPLASGLGGGSSDAAAVLAGLNSLWGLDLSRDELVPLGARLGADVPFFLQGEAALAQGFGERVTPLPPLPQTWIMLLIPPISIPNKTATLYSLLTSKHYTDGHYSNALVEMLNRGSPLDSGSLFNVFEDVAWDAFPGLAELWASLENVGVKRVHLAGSGPSLFTLVSSREEGAAIVESLKSTGASTQLIQTVSSR